MNDSMIILHPSLACPFSSEGYVRMAETIKEKKDNYGKQIHAE